MVAGHLQKKKGYWYIVLNLHDEDGKRKTKWIATHLPMQGNRRRAEGLLLQARQQHTDLNGRKSDQLFFSDYMLQWLAGKKDKVSPTTYQNYKYVIEKGICPYFRERQTTLQTLRAADLEGYYADLQKRGVSSNTALHHHANIHKALKDAVRLDLVNRNVAEIADRPQKQKYLPAHYSVNEVNQLIDKLCGQWMFVPVILSVFYGLRRSEVLGLRWDCVDFEDQTIAIQHTRVLGEVDGKRTAIDRAVLKRRSSYRTLPMVEPIEKMLRDLRHSRYGDDLPPADDYICLNREGKPIPPNYLTQSFRKFLQDNDLRPIRLHDLRHTCASVLIQNRTPLIEVQQWLGHSIRTTSNLQKIEELIAENAPITQLKPGELIVRLSYTERNTSEALISSASRQFEIDINIIFANIESVQGAPIGGTVAIISGARERITAAIAYLIEKNVGVEVLKDARVA